MHCQSLVSWHGDGDNISTLTLCKVAIEAEKGAVKFACNGDIGNGSVSLRNSTSVEKPETNITIELSEPVALTFSLKYLVNFCKASGLSGSVKLCLSNEVPLLVEYELASNSYLRFYLAPKVRDILLSSISDNANRLPRLAMMNRLSFGLNGLVLRCLSMEVCLQGAIPMIGLR